MSTFNIGVQKAKRIINIADDIEVNNIVQPEKGENPWPLQEEWDKIKVSKTSSQEK